MRRGSGANRHSQKNNANEGTFHRRLAASFPDQLRAASVQRAKTSASERTRGDCLAASKMRVTAAVNGVGEFEIILSKRFDERGGVDARCGAEGVMTDDRIIRRNHGVRGRGDLLAVFLEAGEILLNKAHEAKIDEH